MQTEDKGLKTPLILSLVYQGGTILASKRTPYEDLLAGTLDEKLLGERLNRQHSLICAAIRAGRVDDLQKMTKKATFAKRKALVSEKEASQEVISKPIEKKEVFPTINEVRLTPPVEKEMILVPPVETNQTDRSTRPETTIPQSDTAPMETGELKIPKPVDEPVWDIPIVEDVIIVEDDPIKYPQIMEGEIMLPPDAVEIIGDLEQFESLLADELKIKILGENKFNSGDRRNVNILVYRGKKDVGVVNANLMVKIIGSDFRPMIYHAKADTNGVSTVFLKIPIFRTGRAAILVRAMVGGEETELRRAITPG